MKHGFRSTIGHLPSAQPNDFSTENWFSLAQFTVLATQFSNQDNFLTRPNTRTQNLGIRLPEILAVVGKILADSRSVI